MGEHEKKIIAPVIITAILVLYLLGFSVTALVIAPSFGVWIFFGLIPLIMAGVMIAVCVQRIKEIRSGEEDDLSQY